MFEDGSIFYRWLKSSAAAASWLQWHRGSAAAWTGTSGGFPQSPAPSWGPVLRASSEVHPHSKSLASRERKGEQASASVQKPSAHLQGFCCLLESGKLKVTVQLPAGKGGSALLLLGSSLSGTVINFRILGCFCSFYRYAMDSA